MADNPFDQLDGQAPVTGNPFDALDSADDSAIRESVESDPSLKQIMSQFARSRLTDMADMAKNVPNLDSIGTMDERSRARFVGQELKAAQDGLDEVSKAHDETMRNRDAGNLELGRPDDTS